MPDVVHSLKSLYNVRSTYWDRLVQNFFSQLRWKEVEEYLFLLTNLVKLSILDVWHGSKYASGPKYTKIYPNSEYAKVLNMAGFSICEPYIAFWVCPNITLQSSEYISGSK